MFFKGNSIIYLLKFCIKHNMLRFRVGDVMISIKNDNFFVNMGNATILYVFYLRAFIRQIFHQLQREVILVGHFSE